MTQDVKENERKWYLLATRHREIELAEVFQRFQDNGFSPILIKGWAAARNYPSHHNRELGDIDLAFSAPEFDEANRFETNDKIIVDFHRELRHYDTTPWKTIFERSELVEIDGVPIRLLRSEDHLRVLSVHWLNDGGVTKERLWDIFYAVANRPDNFDWDLCLNSVSKTRRKWVTTAISLAHSHLGLDIDGLPLNDQDLSVPRWLERTVEREWSTAIRMRPLHTCLHDKDLFFQQIRKRFPPNPIQATIEGEGKFDEGSRIPIQLKTALIRIFPSIKRVGSSLHKRIRRG